MVAHFLHVSVTKSARVPIKIFMMISMSADSSDVDDLVKQAAAGDPESWAELMKRYRSRLRRMVTFRLDPRLQGRVDPSDVVQDVYLEAWQHLVRT